MFRLYCLSFQALCVFCLSSVSYAASWQHYKNVSTASLRGISVVSEQVVWVSGSANTILRSIDGGKHWQALTAPGDKNSDFRDIQAFNENTAIAMSVGQGSASKLFKTDDAGKTWSLLYENQYDSGFYNGMAFWNRQQGIVYSDAVDGRFLVIGTHDGGQHWQEWGRKSLPLSLKGEHAYAASGTGITVAQMGHAWFASGGAMARVFKTDDYGKTWSAVKTPVISDSATSGIFSIAFFDAQNGIVVGGDYKRRQGVYENVALTSDGGQTWRLAKNFPKGLRSVVLYLNKQVLVTIGSHGSDYSGDAGMSWHPVSDTGFYAADHFNEMVWAVGENGAIAKLDMSAILH